MRSFNDIKALKKPNEASVELILNAELTRALAELEKRHNKEVDADKRHNRTPKAPALAKEIETIKEEIDKSKVEFLFIDPGRQKFDALVEACPPTDKDKADAKKNGMGQPQWDADRFVPGLLALCASDPKLTLEEAQEIYDEWGRGDVEALFNTALQACLEQASIPFTKRDTDAIMASVRNLISASQGESPTPST